MIAIELGHFVSTTTIQTLPTEICKVVKQRTLDILASGLAGFRLGAHGQLFSIMRPCEGATVWGEGVQLSLRDAAVVNSFLAHCTYMDDGDRYSGAHPAAVVIPSAIALAELRHCSGAELISAVVAGYEVLLRIGRAIYPSAVVRGFQSTAILGAIGSAAACGNLLGLSPVATKNAIAIACNLGMGLKDALKCSDSQPLQVARSCEGGILAALYAQQGAEGPDGIIENGFIKAFADKADVGSILEGIGSTFRILDTYVKLHGGCRGNHSAIDVLTEATTSHRFMPNDIEKIRLFVDSVTMAGEIHHPINGKQAQFNVPFAVSVALLKGAASIFQFTDENLADTNVRNLMEKIEVCVDKTFDNALPDKRKAIAEIRLRDGREMRMEIQNARGEPEYPISTEEIIGKFRNLCNGVLGGNTDVVCELVSHLEELKDVAQLTSHLNCQLSPLEMPEPLT